MRCTVTGMIKRTGLFLVAFLCLLVVLVVGPLLRLSLGLSAVEVAVIQVVCGGVGLFITVRELYAQASKQPLTGTQTKRSAKVRNLAGAAVAAIALGAALFFGRRY
jgi:hypothetical protein